jgi:hypothetical protein
MIKRGEKDEGVRPNTYKECGDFRTYRNINANRGIRIVTPIQVKHALGLEIFYSVYGENADGRQMSKPGPGELRLIKLMKGIALPSVSRLFSMCDFPAFWSRFASPPSFRYRVNLALGILVYV